MNIGEILYNTVNYFFQIVYLLILARIILSYLPQFRSHQIAEIIYGITEPILSPFQRIIPPIGMLDISPMVAIVVLIIVQSILVSLVDIAFGLVH